MNQFENDIQSGNRFEFGKNWSNFIDGLDDKLIKNAERSFFNMTGITDLTDKTFLDIGCGSGIVSLIARKLGAQVHSFDYDPDSISCTNRLKNNFFPKDNLWQIEQGSILDIEFISKLGKFDFVYSWGVLHHTGSMFEAIKNSASLCKENGIFFIAIYNDQGWPSKVWWRIKKEYNKSGLIKKKLIVLLCFLRLWGPSFLRDFLKFKPFESYLNYSKERGMKPITDVIDWVGGFPFEYAKPEDILNFLKDKFELINLKTCGGRHGCNEFVFKRISE
jgi:2-polyprenyl-6-hydroxyphenyl methylase/3-demethylubiquinone-9 3-methyltransferase